MLPNLCGICHQTINCLEESINCIGPCGKYYHLSCAKIEANDHDFLLVDGCCRYKCHSCTRRDDDEVCVTPLPKYKLLKDTSCPPEPESSTHFEDLKFSVLKDNYENVIGMLKELNLHVEKMSSDMELLSKEYLELKNYVLHQGNNVTGIMECLDAGDGEPSSHSQNNSIVEEHGLKIVHRTVDVPNVMIFGDIAKQKVMKIQACINSGLSSFRLKSELSELPMNTLPSEANSKKELLKKMTVSRSFPWKFGSFILLLVVAGLLCFDINKHGTFRSSSTGHFLNDIGALQYGEHAWARTKFYSNKSYRWAEKNLPTYYKSVEEYAKPYLELTWDLCLIAGRQLHYMYVNLQAYVEEKTPLVVEWVNHYAPGLLERVRRHSIDLWEIIKENALLLWQYFLHYSFLALEWVKTNVFVGNLSPENLQKYSKEALNTTQDYVIWTYDW
ncbi:hypothetical protein L9F63_009327, partial [Diploptera punctata]